VILGDRKIVYILYFTVSIKEKSGTNRREAKLMEVGEYCKFIVIYLTVNGTH